MGLIQKLLGKTSEDKIEFKKKFKEAQQEQKIQKLLDERSMSSNERELISIQKKERESQILEELKKIRKQENKDNWKSNSILTKGSSILKDDRPILKEKNIFKTSKKMVVDNRNKVPLQTKDKGMFFRW